MILLLYSLALVARQVLGAPAVSSQLDSTQDTGVSSQSTLYGDPSSVLPITSALSFASRPLSNLTDPSSQFSQSNDSYSTAPVIISSAFSPSSAPASFTSPPTSTSFVTEVVTAFETTTVRATPSSVTIVTVVVTATATETIITTPSPSWDNRTLWATPPQMTDLSAFNVTSFPSGQRNLHIVAQIPAQAIAPTAKFLQNPLLSAPNTSTPSTIVQLVYPAHSVNPGNKPEGGADFYATPLNLAGARNVTLEYSVFFPADFNWVKGGKLPGLFGGHTGCSGGASARDCFSTRLMWRPHGVGELYLYAPKDKQSEALCADVRSVCDASYGFSIGRGAFNFTAGDWTHLSQNVVLNTPGQNDGVFTLFVDGRPMINRTDMFYRDVAQQAKKNNSTPRTSNPVTASVLRVTEITLDENGGVPQPTEFLGLFFSTFFGGHGKQYATPKQQYTWFKDFAITRHD